MPPPRIASTDEMKTIEPPPPSIITGIAAWLSMNGDTRLTSMTSCSSSGVVSRNFEFP